MFVGPSDSSLWNHIDLHTTTPYPHLKPMLEGTEGRNRIPDSAKQKRIKRGSKEIPLLSSPTIQSLPPKHTTNISPSQKMYYFTNPLLLLGLAISYHALSVSAAYCSVAPPCSGAAASVKLPSSSLSLFLSPAKKREEKEKKECP